MNTSPLPSKSKLSSFDDMVEWVDGAQLLFRLHSNKFCRTFFHPKENVLVSSLHRQNLSEDSTSEDLSLRLTALEKAPSSLTDEDSEAVERHITSWINNDKEKSNFISLTLNVLHALWLWKRRIPSLTQSEGREDDFRIIVLNSSKLRAQAKLGTELLSNEPEKHKEARRFALQHEEVIVAKHIKSEAILGSMPMSRLEAFIPSWCRKLLETPKSIPGSKKLTFVESLPPRVDKVDCAMVRESLRFSLALLAPMLVPDEKLQANIGSGKEAGRGAIEHSRTEGDSRVKPACGPEMVLVSGHSVTEEGGSQIPASHSLRKRGLSPEVGSLPAGTAGESLQQEPPAKQRRLSEEGQHLHSRLGDVRSSDTERDSQALVETESLKWECERVVALATDICNVSEEGREECKRLHAVHGLELLKQYKTAMQRRDSGMEALETLIEIMDRYEGWNEGKS